MTRDVSMNVPRRECIMALYPAHKDDPKHRHATVVHPLSFTPLSLVTILITRRWDKKARMWIVLSPQELDGIEPSTVPNPVGFCASAEACLTTYTGGVSPRPT
ncbi:uncharacterized protein DSM5745_07176 [Aspergillus mulundensis]|uniref:Uncharacterized protein n=1 Tax=Aspergillus mulundensis TaxID=1810919 RepID=A0A3D8RKT2_9EURO|nr:hypothetical protein DSM5745_07176 [Aspergillus mulundensis]RDW74514.1 hypothetical protein DSM5745_07176 [Aspergillus mulundensis]